MRKRKHLAGSLTASDGSILRGGAGRHWLLGSQMVEQESQSGAMGKCCCHSSLFSPWLGWLWSILCPGKSRRNNLLAESAKCFPATLTHGNQQGWIICQDGQANKSFIHSFTPQTSPMVLRCPEEVQSLVWRADTSRSLGSTKPYLF